MDGLIAKLTAKKRENRFQSATDLVVELQPWLAQNPFDEAAEHIWSGLDFKSRAVERLLSKEKIDIKKADSELNMAARPRHFKSRRLVIASLILLLLIAGGGLFFELGSRFNLKQAVLSGRNTPAGIQTRKSGVPGNQLGGLFVTTQPKGATVMFQSGTKTSPASFEQIPIGRYAVKVSLNGYQGWLMSVE